MNGAVFRCIARVLNMVAGSLVCMLPVGGWAFYVTYTEADSASLPSMGGESPELAFMLSSNLFEAIRDVSMRPP